MNNMECTEQYEKYGTDDPLSKTSYWIFQAAKGMHSKFKALKTKITEKTIISGLRIGQMVSDFGGNEDDTGDMVKWLASASAIGGALSGLSANVRILSPCLNSQLISAAWFRSRPIPLWRYLLRLRQPQARGDRPGQYLSWFGRSIRSSRRPTR